jgi:hypothetical protein
LHTKLMFRLAWATWAVGAIVAWSTIGHQPAANEAKEHYVTASAAKLDCAPALSGHRPAPSEVDASVPGKLIPVSATSVGCRK